MQLIGGTANKEDSIWHIQTYWAWSKIVAAILHVLRHWEGHILNQMLLSWSKKFYSDSLTVAFPQTLPRKFITTTFLLHNESRMTWLHALLHDNIVSEVT